MTIQRLVANVKAGVLPSHNAIEAAEKELARLEAVRDAAQKLKINVDGETIFVIYNETTLRELAAALEKEKK